MLPLEALYIFGPIVLLVAIVVLSQRSRNAAQQRLNAARTIYQERLQELTKSPTDPDVKQRTLAAGRQYMTIAREQKGTSGITIFDEVALSNDISAATAAATSSAAPPQLVPIKVPVEDRLRQLDDLKTRGVVTEIEWQSRREKILEDI